MKPKNKYVKRSKISEAKFREVLRLFSYELTAKQISQITKLNRNTVNRYMLEIRKKVADYCERTSPIVKGEIEVDESYFGAKRIKGKHGRGAYGKTIVFGLYKRGENVYTEIVPNCSKAVLQGIIRGKVLLDSVIHSDGWKGYDGLVDIGYDKHFRVNHSADEFAEGNSHINGIEGFWGCSKNRLTKFKGVSESTFYFHLKECEFRFNNRNFDIYKLLLKIIKINPLF